MSGLAKLDLDAVEAGIFGQLAKVIQPKKGDAEAPAMPDLKAIGALRQLIDDVRDLQAKARHETEMQRLADRPPQLARYLGELGSSEELFESIVGRRANEDEIEQMELGAQFRRLTIRAVERSRVERGGKIQPWMTR